MGNKVNCRAIMLPTEDITDIIVPTKGVGKGVTHLREYYVSAMLDMGDQYQHLYITVDQDVELLEYGDWVYEYNLSENRIYQIHEARGKLCFFRFENVPIWLDTSPNNARKIIATTNPELTTSNTITDETLYLPQVTQSFIKEYVDNPNGVWEVEYEKGNYDDLLDNGGSPPPMKLKLNKDNTVNTTLKKTYKLWE